MTSVNTYVRVRASLPSVDYDNTLLASLFRPLSSFPSENSRDMK